MDLHEQRLQCLKMAFELGGKPEPVLSAAQQLLDFLNPKPQSEAGDAPIAHASSVSEPVPEPVPDPIAACGTALVMPEGGELADAVPTSADASTVVAEPDASAIEAPVAEAPAEADVAPSADPASPSEASNAATEQPEAATAAESVEQAPAEAVKIEEATAEIASAAVETAAAVPVASNGSGDTASPSN